MNKSYFLYKNNDIVVQDENGNKRVIKYQDNIEDLLLQENLIETLEKEVETLEIETSKIKINPKYVKISNLSLQGFGVLSSFTIPQVLVYLNGSNPIVETALGTMSLSTLLTILAAPIGILITSAITTVISINDIERLNHKNGLKTELSYLKKVLEESKNQLNKLKINDSCSRTTFDEQYKEFKVDDSQITHDVKSVKDLYYNCGYYEKNWFKLYKKGKLKTKLKKFKEHEIKLIEEHFEEKTKRLIK